MPVSPKTAKELSNMYKTHQHRIEIKAITDEIDQQLTTSGNSAYLRLTHWQERHIGEISKIYRHLGWEVETPGCNPPGLALSIRKK